MRIKILSGLIIVLLSTAALSAQAQGNPGFESGLNGWQAAGKVIISNNNAHDGESCAQLGAGYGMVMQHLNAKPFAIVLFNFYVKCSDSTNKVYSFIRFYNVQHKLLLEYKSGAINAVKYQQSGNYTEAPPATGYMEIGVESDPQNTGSVYVDDLELQNNVGEPKTYHRPLCNLNQYMHPFWRSDTIYNETVLFYSVDGKAADGKLLFMPSKILSVKKFDLSTTYKAGIDYTVAGKVITRMQGSAMSFKADTSFDRKTDLAWFNLQSQWVVVTYIHHDKWAGPVPQYKGNRVPHTIAKLKAKKPLKIIAYGMSITRGLDVSSYDTVPPYMPTYVSLFAGQLKKNYHDNHITLYNAGLPGSIVDWGAQYAGQYISAVKPDLVIIDFGMNDFWRYTPEQFKGYIETIMSKVKAKNPQVEFLLLSNMKFDPDYILDSDKNKAWYMANLESYSHVLQQMETKGVINLDMTSLSDFIYHQKKAKDCISNPLHPNDYLARWYAQGLTALLSH